ncbi:MAG: 4Fe-4S dicluster domain-containing protein [Gemmatimonadales bacterium]|nr:4Fe-4S dicluster domain-containing protein [Gemmatimonadales bacterium]NIN48682.1 4Fe-4S dicluster domain-containing protein [Gemmatimonadales bacterium]NIP06146.1 4Fe-4S dicluster domain-containing protein [Gemmatimonadales bacterium]NIR01320.1 4Fe-4S dicluster domain-containing protein [Gemmatimonadales bacterium]
MTRWGMVIDLDRCTGCAACEVACKSENNIATVSPEQADMGRAMSWMQVMAAVEGEFPHTSMQFHPRPCMHCDNPPCIKVCPVQATYIDDEGIVGQIYPRCIGCRYCANACPYLVKYFNWYGPEWAESERQYLNPDVSVRPAGVIEKCTFCHHRLQKAREDARAEGRGLREEDYQPACAEICPTGAIVFGDLDDPTHHVAELKEDPRVTRLMEDLGTQPKVYYLRPRD